MNKEIAKSKFVVQRHQAKTLHYDLRLERDGVFKSWAVPKGLPEEVGVKRLAIQVKDHSLEFGDFEGTIPSGEYGAGSVEIWDRGSYATVEWSGDKIVVEFHGRRINGLYDLVRFSRGGENAWLIFKKPL